MPTFSRESIKHSQDADGLSILQTSCVARSVSSLMRFCARTTLTRSESSKWEILAGTPFVLSPHRALPIIFRLSIALHWRSQTMRTAGMVANCSFTSDQMEIGKKDGWLVRQISGARFSSSYIISWK